MTNTLELCKELISKRSLTPNDSGCQDLIATRLEKLGFTIEPMRFEDVDNLWARKGVESPLFVFAGHTDVVPTGPEDAWQHPPFEPTVADGHLYGRGAADMKSAVAAMVTAAERFLSRHNNHNGSIGFLLTSDEEGAGINGTVKVVETLARRGEQIDLCIVGEPTGVATVGDTIKNGRRGSLTGKLTVHGVQGHVAYPHRAVNPIHQFAPALAELNAQQWDSGNQFFSPTSLQFSNINSGTGADNVIPSDLHALFNFRFSSALTAEQLKRRTEEILSKHKLNYDVQWRLSGEPFLTDPGSLTDAVSTAISEVCGIKTELSTSGGTSDARFIAPTGAQVIELGVVNATIHKVNEHVAVADIDKLSAIYERVLELLLL